MKTAGGKGKVLLFCSLQLGFCLGIFGAEPGESVVVVYNSRLAESREVATHYAAARHVPTGRVAGFDLPEGENMTRAEYRDKLEGPLLNFLEKEKLFVFEADEGTTNGAAPSLKLKEARFRYLVLCFGVPLRILDDPQLSDPGAEKLPPQLQGRNGAAVDSELMRLPEGHKKMLLAGPLVNPCFGATNAGRMDATNGVLMVARLDGPTSEIAGHLVDKAMEAERDGLWGRAYFDLRGLTNGDYKRGDDWLRGAAESARRYGFETVVDDRPETFSAGFPMSQIALYAGWYNGTASGPFTRSEVEFMAGAFAYHLHSFSAHTLRSATEYWCGPLLAKGVTATMGCIDEPYLDGTPNMEVFFSRWLLGGFSYGEAACAAQRVVSWQTTVVGDPLYRPFAESPQARHEELRKRHSKLMEWSDLQWANLNLVAGVVPAEVVRYLEKEPATRQSAVLTEKLADLYQAQGKAEMAIRAFRQALALHPSPQQSVRLTFDLGDQLLARGREADALKLYDEFLKGSPDYPEALALYQKIEPLALQLGKKSQAARYAAKIKKLSPAR